MRILHFCFERVVFCEVIYVELGVKVPEEKNEGLHWPLLYRFSFECSDEYF